jgi:hypothetical protein
MGKKGSINYLFPRELLCATLSHHCATSISDCLVWIFQKKWPKWRKWRKNCFFISVICVCKSSLKNNLRPVAPRPPPMRSLFSQSFTNFWNLIGGHSHTRLPPVFFDSPRRSLSAAPHSRALLLLGLS